jgi:anhydro-N-acetylmuramic acid kinase
MNNGSSPKVLVGLMSGTSLDGISSAVVRFSLGDGDRVHYELLATGVGPYDAERRNRLLRAVNGAPPAEYCRLNVDLAHWFADAAVAVLAEAGVPRSEIAAIASHGQTIWHEPGHSTWQVGEPAVIAERTGIDTITNFRARDVAADGQGAPLVPIADALLFSAPGHWRALQNLGGIGNVTIVPPGGGIEGTRAFDTGPGVMVIDGVVRTLVPPQTYDADGAIARTGTAIDAVVDELLEAPYFASPPPKSTGRELFDAAYVDRLIARCREIKPSATVGDIAATAVGLTARSIADAYHRFLPEPVGEVVVSGGGAKNPTLVAAIREVVAPLRVSLFDDVFFDGEAKEAVAFAFLGWLHLMGRSGNVPAVTGARGPRVLGQLTPGNRSVHE